jgi:hypothetical protein
MVDPEPPMIDPPAALKDRAEQAALHAHELRAARAGLYRNRRDAIVAFHLVSDQSQALRLVFNELRQRLECAVDRWDKRWLSPPAG